MSEVMKLSDSEIIDIVRKVALKGEEFSNSEEKNLDEFTKHSKREYGRIFKTGDVSLKVYTVESSHERPLDHEYSTYEWLHLEVSENDNLVFNAYTLLQKGPPLQLVSPEPKDFIIAKSELGNWVVELQKEYHRLYN